jgi:hypothetical protein
MKFVLALSMVFTVLSACQSSGASPSGEPATPTSGPSGLEVIRIEARGME